MTTEILDQQHLVFVYMCVCVCVCVRRVVVGVSGGGVSERETLETSLREREIGTSIN
jgi:hypothetical protein